MRGTPLRDWNYSALPSPAITGEGRSLMPNFRLSQRHYTVCTIVLTTCMRRSKCKRILSVCSERN